MEKVVGVVTLPMGWEVGNSTLMPIFIDLTLSVSQFRSKFEHLVEFYLVIPILLTDYISKI